MNENGLGELYAALAAARQEFGKLSKSKTANAGKFSYNYADLSDVIEATAPALAKHGLIVIQDPEVVIDGGKPLVVVHGCIAHQSGAVHHLHPLPMPADSNSSQAIGSALTYARRYQLSAALNLAAEDDDGAAATKTPQQPQERTQGRTTPNHTAQPRQAQQRHATQPTANVDDAPEVDPDGPGDDPFDEAPARGEAVRENTLKRLHIVGQQFYKSKDAWDAKRPELVEHISKGAVTSSKDLTEAEARKLAASLEAKLAKAQQPDAKLHKEAA